MSRTKNDFLTLYEPVHDAFSRFCHAKAYGLIEAEDLISETVLKALENFANLKDDKAFLSYLFSTASNILNKKNRRIKFRGEYDDKMANSLFDQGLKADVKMDIDLLYQALNTLPELQKEALILFEISGFSIKEVAEIQKAGLSSVKQRLKRGRAALAVIFQSDQLDAEDVSSRSKLLMSVFL